MKLTQEEFEKVSSNVDIFNQFLISYRDYLFEYTLKAIPVMIANLVRTSESVVGAAESFYKDNPNFVQYKELVMKIVERIDAENPGKSLDEIFKLAKPLIDKAIVVNGGERVLDRPDVTTLNDNLNGLI